MRICRATFITLWGVYLLSFEVNAQWIQTSGPSGSGAFVVGLTSIGPSLVAGTAGGVFLSTTGGVNWNQIGTRLATTTVMCLAANESTLFAATNSSGIFRSPLGDTSWTQINSGLTYYDVRALATNGSYLFAGTWGGGICRSTNNGTTWDTVNNGLTTTSVRAFAVMGSYLFAGTWEGDVFRSSNNGLLWISTRNGPTDDQVYALTVSGTNLFAGTTTGVLVSSDAGTHWGPAGLTGTYVQSLIASDNNLLAGTPGGIFVSTNSGGTWTSVNDGLTFSSVWALAINGLQLFAGTVGGGVWRRPLSEMITAVDDGYEHMPSVLLLDQNFPNPFNPSTTISFSLPSRLFVSIRIFDLRGREVTEIVSEEFPQGRYVRTWNAENISSGVYFCRLKTGASIITRKLIVMR